jgi:hypothetical protein
MKRKIESPYNYLDYRLILNDDFLSRSASNSSYSLRAYSRDLAVSPGFLSEVLRGQKDLRLSSGKKLFSKLGFVENEMLYIESLINLKISEDEFVRESAEAFVRQHHKLTFYEDRPEKSGFVKSLEHFLVFGITRKISNLTEIHQHAKTIGIAPARVNEVLSDLVHDGYVSRNDTGFHVNDMALTIKTDSMIHDIISSLSILISELVKKNGGIKIPDQIAQGLILGLDEKSYLLAVQAHKQFIQQLSRLAAGSSKVDRFAFVTSHFFSHNLKKE